MMAKRKKKPEKVFGTCALCQQERQLCDSHIIPVSFFKDVIAAPHGLEVSIDVNVFNKRNRNGYHQYLLCDDCEGIIQKYEDEGNRIIKNANGVHYSQRSEDILQCHGLNYTKFKLFQLSILWRMAVSTLPIFEQVKLNADVQETLRKMVLNGDAGEAGDYGCVIEARIYKGGFARQFFMPPQYAVLEIPNLKREVWRYIVIFGGWEWHFFPFLATDIPPEIRILFTQKDGTFYFGFNDILNVEGFRNAIAEMITAERKRKGLKR